MVTSDVFRRACACMLACVHVWVCACVPVCALINFKVVSFNCSEIR